MIRVLVDGIIYGQQQYGGISRYFNETFEKINLNHDDIQIILHLPAKCKSRTPRAEWINKIKDYEFKPRRIFNGVGKQLSISKVRLLRPQIFHSTYYTLPYWSELKSVVTVHDFIHEKYPALFGNSHWFIDMKKKVIEKADAIIAVSNSTKEDILNYTKVEESRITIIYHGVSEIFIAGPSSDADIDMFKKTHKIEGPYWLYVGYRGGYKNFGTLFRAFIKVSQQSNGYLIVVGGEENFEPWQIDLLIKNRLEHRVRMLYPITDDELKVAYSGAAAFVFPSLAEGFGIPLLEAMACKTPIIVSDISVFREVADNTALYFNPNDEEALCEALMQVLVESNRQSLIKNCLKRVKEFSWDTSAQRLGDVYKSLI